MVLQSKTWHGVVYPAHGEDDDANSIRQRRRRKAFKPSLLPPLSSLPPPISLSNPIACDLDLLVDFDMDIKPHLRECLVGPNDHTRLHML